MSEELVKGAFKRVSETIELKARIAQAEAAARVERAKAKALSRLKF